MPLARLNQKLVELELFLSGRMEAINELRAQRRAELDVYNQELLGLAAQRSTRLEALAVAESQVRVAEAVVIAAHLKLALAQAWRDEVTLSIGTTETNTAICQGARRVSWEKWRLRLRQLQDGRTRRKWGQLHRLRLRLARREAEIAAEPPVPTEGESLATAIQFGALPVGYGSVKGA
jgi:hypothetical protein